MYVVGTAGHVDHGKSTLIKAMTGIDPDRLREEKERQMTIDLGFAWMQLPSGQEIGIVDVPGHRDFIENMLAGVGGIDAVLFVIAADEGVMPQTKEHLAIIDLLGIKNGIIVLTKVDLVDDQEWLALVREEIKTLVRGTSLSNAEILPVSSINGIGIGELISSLDHLLELHSPKKNIGKPRLPIDRVFSLKGFGTVVTGTLLDGQFKVGQQVVVLPSEIETRIRGIQTHKKQTLEVQPGTRTALNLIGVEVNQLQRGDVVADAGVLSPTRCIDMQFRMIKGAGRKLTHDEYVKVFTGTAQNYARVRMIARDEIQPGEEGWLQLEFNEKIVVKAGDHCILRRPSPPETIGGGIVLDPHPQRRHKRFAGATISHFELLESEEPHKKIMGLLKKSSPMIIEEVTDQVGLSHDEVVMEVDQMVLNGEVVCLKNDKTAGKDQTLLVHRYWIDQWTGKTIRTLEKFHRDFPLRAGMKKDNLRTELGLSPKLFIALLEYFQSKQIITQKSGLVSLPHHQVIFNDEHDKKINEIMNIFQKSPFKPPTYQDLVAEFGDDLLAALVEQGELVRTSEQIIYRKEEYEEMRAFINDCLRMDGYIELGKLRDQFNTSRKYALSFLEYLDQIGYTERKGDIHILRAGEIV